MIWKRTALRVFGWFLLTLAALTMLYYAFHMLVGGISSVAPALRCALAVCAPLLLGTTALVLAAPDVAARRRIVRAMLWTLFGFYLFAMAAVLLVARIDWKNYPAQCAFYRANYDLMTNLVPFATIKLYVRCLIYDFIGVGVPMSNLVGNVLLFMPMAFFLPCLFDGMRVAWKFLLLMVLLLAAVEAMQLILCCGSCDVDDVILNLAGTMVVFGALRLPFVRRALQRLYILPATALAQFPASPEAKGETPAGLQSPV